MPKNDRICCHGYDLNTLPEGSNRILHNTDSETDTQWLKINKIKSCSWFLKINHALKSHPIRTF